MIKKVIKTIEKYQMLDKKDRVIVALSGGPDSTALLVALTQIAHKLELSLIAAHFNHGLRGKESDEDEKYSQALAQKFDLTFVTQKMDLKQREKGKSPEEYYRQQRYGFLNKVAADHNAQKIALGHNQQDQAETVLLNLLRGSGLAGLKGILPMRDGKFIRPLIEVSRPEIIVFLDKAEISYCEDSSNKSNIYLRNRIRGELIPFLKEKFNPAIEENLAQMAEILRQDDEFIRQFVKDALEEASIEKNKNEIALNIDYLNSLAPAIRLRLLKQLLESLNPEKNGFSFNHINSLEKMLQKNVSGKRVSLPMGIEISAEYDSLILAQKTTPFKKVQYEYEVQIPGQAFIQERKVKINMQLVPSEEQEFNNKNKAYLDMEKIKQPVVLRNRRDGDWFVPLGMQGRQKIKSLFIDRKIPRRKRDEIMLLADQESIIWIENMHLCDRVKVTSQTRQIIALEITK